MFKYLELVELCVVYAFVEIFFVKNTKYKKIRLKCKLRCSFALQLRALSHILQTPIEVIQMDSPPIIVGEEYSRKPLIVV